MRAEGRPSASTVASVIAVGSGTWACDRLVHPGVELLEGVGVDVGLVEALEGVVVADVGDVHGGPGRG